MLLLAVGVITSFSIGSVLLFVLFVTHALVGAVELGTDGWIQNITGNLFTSEQGKYLFIWTSAIMFSLRFCAHFIEKTLKISPVGLLFICAVLACVGLNLASGMTTFGMALGRARHLRRRQDLLLADHAGRRSAIASRRRAPSPCPSWAASACSPPA